MVIKEIKKYDFVETLKDYNKEYGGGYKLNNPEIFQATIIHFPKKNQSEISYNYSDGGHNYKNSLAEFICYNVSTGLSCSRFQAFIISREEHNSDLKIKILPPNKIRYAYLDSNYYAPNVGQLGSSCMRHKEMQRALNFYTKNKVKIVVIVDNNNKIHARALLWDNVRSIKLKKPFTYLDRVYAISYTLLSLFYDLAEENKWKRYPSTVVNRMDKHYYKKDIIVAGMYHLPFMDTFRYLYVEDNLLAASTKLKINRDSIPYTTLNIHTNCGYYPDLDPNRIREVFSRKYISKKDAIFVKRYDGFVLKKNIANINGNYYSVFDNNISKTVADGYVLKKDLVIEVVTNDKIDRNKAVHSPKHKGYIHKSNVIYIEDKLYHKLDNDITCFENKWYHISQCFINYNREDVNKELETPVCTPKGNREFVKQSLFFNRYLPGNYMRYLTLMWSFCREKGPTITREGDLVPKEHAIIAYNLICNAATDDIVYQAVYCINKTGFIQLVTGEFIINSSKNKQHLKKFNNKWYIKREFKPPNKKQLMLFGNKK